ncbi:MAG: hypothetical protein V1895_03490 [Parcubacteria group bacterium]
MVLAWVMLSALLVTLLVLFAHWRTHLPGLVPLAALLPIGVYLSAGQGPALWTALALMSLTVLLEVIRLVSPRLNRRLMARLRPLLGARETTRPLSLSSAIVAVALLIALVNGPVAFFASLAGLLVPSLARALSHELRLSKQISKRVRPRVVPYLALGLAVLLVGALLVPAATGARLALAGGIVAAGAVTLLPIPVDAYLLAPVAAAAILLIA